MINGRFRKDCKVCGLPKVALVRGHKCDDCITEVYALDRIRRKRASIHSVTRRSVLTRDVVCRYCGTLTTTGVRDAPTNREYDHVISVRLGGSGAAENVVLSCHRCNHTRQGLQTILLAPYRNALKAETDPAVLSVYSSRSLIA